MKWLLLILMDLGLVLFLGCIKKPEATLPPVNTVKNTNITTTTNLSVAIENKFEKQLAENFRFMASFEKEIFKTVLGSKATLNKFQFEVISFALDQHIGINRQLNFLDCKIFELKKINYDTNSAIDIYKKCEVPHKKIVQIISKRKNIFEVIFFTQEWASVVGISVALTQPNRVCNYEVSTENKIVQFQCNDSAVELSIDNNVQELRLKEINFKATRADQVNVLGGYYKDLIMYKQLKLKIPMDGAIKLIEKEIQIKDDFAELQNLSIKNQENSYKLNSNSTAVQLKGTNEENNKKNNQEASEENNQEIQAQKNQQEFEESHSQGQDDQQETQQEAEQEVQQENNQDVQQENKETGQQKPIRQRRGR